MPILGKSLEMYRRDPGGCRLGVEERARGICRGDRDSVRTMRCAEVSLRMRARIAQPTRGNQARRQCRVLQKREFEPHQQLIRVGWKMSMMEAERSRP